MAACLPSQQGYAVVVKTGTHAQHSWPPVECGRHSDAREPAASQPKCNLPRAAGAVRHSWLPIAAGHNHSTASNCVTDRQEQRRPVTVRRLYSGPAHQAIKGSVTMSKLRASAVKKLRKARLAPSETKKSVAYTLIRKERELVANPAGSCMFLRWRGCFYGKALS